MSDPRPGEGVVLADADPRDAAALFCLGCYYDELAQRLAHGFQVSLSRDPDALDMLPPRGAFILAWSGDAAIGCVGLKGRGGGDAEVKRLWVAPEARGKGLARRLMAAVEDRARGLGISRLLLDTNSALGEALALYRGSGWTEIARFNDDPYPDAFFEKRL